MSVCPVCHENHDTTIIDGGVYHVPAPTGPRPPSAPPRPRRSDDEPIERVSYPCLEGLNGDHYAHARCLREAGYVRGAV